MFYIETANYDDFYATLLTNYPLVQKLTGQYMSDAALNSLATATNSKLTYINFEVMNERITDKGFELLFKRSPHLRSVLVEGAVYEELGYNNGCHATDAAIQAMVTHCPLIEDLSLMYWHTLTDLSLSYIASLSQLKELVLAHSYTFTSAGVVSMLMKCGKNLEVFVLGALEDSVDSILKCLASYCPRLREVTWHDDCEDDTTSSAVLALVRGCPCLERIDSERYAYDDQVLVEVSECCPNLQYIDLSRSYEITDMGLIALSKGCPGLKKLHLSSPAITSEALLSVAKHCHQLESINLRGCEGFYSLGLIALIEANPHLESILLDSCSHIGDEVILAAAQYCLKLNWFPILRCQSLSVRSLTKLIDKCYLSLETIGIGRSDMTDAFVDLLLHKCKRLNYLEINDCPNITERSLVTLLSLGAKLCTIRIYNCALKASKEYRKYYYGIAPVSSDSRGTVVMLSRDHMDLPWLP